MRLKIFVLTFFAFAFVLSSCEETKTVGKKIEGQTNTMSTIKPLQGKRRDIISIIADDYHLGYLSNQDGGYAANARFMFDVYLFTNTEETLEFLSGLDDDKFLWKGLGGDAYLPRNLTWEEYCRRIVVQVSGLSDDEKLGRTATKVYQLLERQSSEFPDFWEKISK